MIGLSLSFLMSPDLDGSTLPLPTLLDAGLSLFGPDPRVLYFNVDGEGQGLGGGVPSDRSPSSLFFFLPSFRSFILSFFFVLVFSFPIPLGSGIGGEGGEDKMDGRMDVPWNELYNNSQICHSPPPSPRGVVWRDVVYPIHLCFLHGRVERETVYVFSSFHFLCIYPQFQSRSS